MLSDEIIALRNLIQRQEREIARLKDEVARLNTAPGDGTALRNPVPPPAPGFVRAMHSEGGAL